MNSLLLVILPDYIGQHNRHRSMALNWWPAVCVWPTSCSSAARGPRTFSLFSDVFSLQIALQSAATTKNVQIQKVTTPRCDKVAEWLRRWAANPLCSARVGLNPVNVWGYTFKFTTLRNFLSIISPRSSVFVDQINCSLLIVC